MNTAHSHAGCRSQRRPVRRRSVLAALVLGHWRGEHGPVASAAVPLFLLLGLSGVMSVLIDSVDWVWHYRLVAPVLIAVTSLLLAVSAWGLIGAVRGGKRADDDGAGRLAALGPAVVVATCVLATSAGLALQADAWIAWLWALTTDRDERAEIRADAGLGRLVVHGPFGFGTTVHVDEALRSHPEIRLVELDSPGGYAVEGLALGKLLEAHDVDTLVLSRCASACISAFAGGNRRLLGKHGRLGFHSAEGGRQRRAMALNRRHAEFLRQRGVASWLIEQEMDTPFESILVPGPATLLGSGLVTDMWESR